MNSMRFSLKLFPANDEESTLAQTVLGRLQALLTTTPAPIAAVSEVVPDASGFIVASALEVDGFSDLNVPEPTTGLNFGGALAALKAGKKVARTGWNGQGMWAVLQKGYPDGIAINANTAQATGLPEGTVCKFRPYFLLYTAQGDFAHWIPSGSDMLADDWVIIA
jgi:hypothetical protein